MAYIREVTCVAFQLVNTGFFFCGGVLVVFVVFTRRASVFVSLKAILIPACLNKLVTFLIFGDMKVKVAHFSFFLGFVSWVGEGD